MIIGRFVAHCRSDRADEFGEAIAAVQAPSRKLPGVVHFDVTRSLTEPDTFVVLEVFEDREALDRQNAQDEVAAVLGLVQDGVLTAEPEWTEWEGAPTG